MLGTTTASPRTPSGPAIGARSPPTTIRQLARRMAEVRTLVTVTWSLQRIPHGEQPVWAGLALAALLGQIGLPGGGFGHGYGSMGDVGSTGPAVGLPTFSKGPNPVKTFIPVARIADMLLSPGQQFTYDGGTYTYPDIRLVYWAGGNPFHHHQDLDRLRTALGRAGHGDRQRAVLDGHGPPRRHRVADDDPDGARRLRRWSPRQPPHRDASGDVGTGRGTRRPRDLPADRRSSRRRRRVHRGPHAPAVARAHLRQVAYADSAMSCPPFEQFWARRRHRVAVRRRRTLTMFEQFRATLYSTRCRHRAAASNWPPKWSPASATTTVPAIRRGSNPTTGRRRVSASSHRQPAVDPVARPTRRRRGQSGQQGPRSRADPDQPRRCDRSRHRRRRRRACVQSSGGACLAGAVVSDGRAARCRRNWQPARGTTRSTSTARRRACTETRTQSREDRPTSTCRKAAPVSRRASRSNCSPVRCLRSGRITRRRSSLAQGWVPHDDDRQPDPHRTEPSPRASARRRRRRSPTRFDSIYLFEPGHLPVYYLPKQRRPLRPARAHRPIRRTARCKGDAEYWSIVVDERRIENAVWSYPVPLPDGAQTCRPTSRSTGTRSTTGSRRTKRSSSTPAIRTSRVDALALVAARRDSRSTARRRRHDAPDRCCSRPACQPATTSQSSTFARPAARRRRSPPHARTRDRQLLLGGRPRRQRWSRHRLGLSASRCRRSRRFENHFCFFNEHVDVIVDGELQERPKTNWS